MHPLRRLSPGRSLVALLVLTAFLAGFFQGTQVECADAKVTPKLELQRGDHICIIGNTLADRIQHFGWLETLIHARFPKHELVFRNLGFSGDEITFRQRSMDFGTPDQWLSGSAPIPQPNKLPHRDLCRENRFELTNTKADVIFAFFGYNESFAGEAGLPKFKQDLEAFIKHTLAQKYNGKSAPRLVLFSPIAHENLHDRNLPDGKENNKRLAVYTAAMAEVARANKVPFVDLFRPTSEPYDAKARPMTINGIHLNEIGDRVVANIVDMSLFGEEPERDQKALEKLRAAVNEKSFLFYNHYRATDGYSTFGDRAFLQFNDRQTNYEVVQRELEALDVMVSNRDKRIWSVARSLRERDGSRSEPTTLDDSNTPPLIPVKTNKPGQGPNGDHLYLDGQEAISKMTVGKNMKVSLFASEKDFPELVKPVQMAWDTKGRLWVAVWPSYPHWNPKEEMNDKLIILEDTDGDGKADKVTVFADHLHNPTGFEFWNGGVLVAQAPDLLYLKDTKGTGKADLRVRVLSGLDTADTHHTSNSFALDPGGALYFQEGTFHHTQVETPYGPCVRCANAGVYRYEPRTQRFETYVTFGFANPHGHVFDRWGRDIVVDGTGANPFDGALFSGHLDFPNKHGRPPQVYQQRTRPCAGVEFLSSKHFPPDMQGDFLVCNVIGFQGVQRYKIEDKDASFIGIEQEPIVYSSDPNFRPSDIKIGPDGAIYLLDWQNTIIGHMQHNLRDPSRDHAHGRIYKVTYEGRPLTKPRAIAGEPIEKLLDALKDPDDRVRYRARIELTGRDSDAVIAAATKWLANLPSGPAAEHDRLEALWLHQSHNVVDAGLLSRMLASPDPLARAAATRVLCYWRDRVPDALDLLKKQATDAHPRVRLEAVRAASFFAVPEAVEVPLIASERPADPFIEFVKGETLRALDPYVKKAIASGQKIKFTTAAGARYFLKNVGTDDLLKMKRDQGVYVELLFRKGVRDEYRREALGGLARLENKNELRVLLDAIHNHDDQAGGSPEQAGDETVAFDLVRLLTDRKADELAGQRADLERLATSARQPLTRELGYVALMAADNNTDRAWALANHSVFALQDLLNAVPLVRDAGLRASLYPKVEPLLDGLPKSLAPATSQTGDKVVGRYVRIELPGKRKTLTLAEVEVFSGGRNVARQGKASQKNTAHGGDAAKAIDGNTSGRFGDAGQTHSQENTDSPWWEVDLGADYPITSIVIWNRTEDGLGKRLDSFTLKVTDAQHRTVFERKKNPAPVAKATFDLGADSPETVIRRAAMFALVSVRGQEGPTFTSLARFVRADKDRAVAIQALQRIPSAYWPAEEVRPLLGSLLAYIRKLPAAARTTPAALDALQLGDALAAALPLAEAKKIRKELGELGVRVIRLGTLPEQMLFDQDKIAVRAGKPVEIVLENGDFMPHNFAILQPGSLEEVGNLGEATATQPGAAERQYVPPSPKILLASRLLQPRESQKLSFTAPSKPGVYPYVCTYPGHWRRMYGALYVVEDLDEYLADAEGYLAMHPLPITDELLKFIRPRKEWKFEELASAVEHMDGGRSFTSGKQIFTVASCVSCHKFNGVGTEMGPDLTKIDPKQQAPVEILRDILEPSFRINEKYQTYVFALESGKTVTGLILEETKDTVKVIENPLAKAEPVLIKKSDIADRSASKNSIMPKGLLDKLTREEILDLVAYVAARGDANHKLFHGAHAHGH